MLEWINDFLYKLRMKRLTRKANKHLDKLIKQMKG